MGTWIASGSYGDVYDLGDGTVLKAYRRRWHTRSPRAQHLDDHELVSRVLWKTEADVYCRIQDDPVFADIRSNFPRYFGSVDPLSLDLRGTPKGTELLRDCGLRLELLAGKGVKMNLLDEPMHDRALSIIQALEDRFRRIAVGLISFGDATVFQHETGLDLRLVDFASPNELFIDMCVDLEEHGRLSDSVRNRATCAIG